MLSFYHSALNMGNHCTWRPESYPAFLQEVQHRLSDFVLNKVTEGYDIYLANRENIRESAWRARLNGHGSDYHLAADSGRVVHVSSADWNCSCAHYLTWRLPCRHIMKVVDDFLKYPQLPTTCIHARWNIYRGAVVNAPLLRTIKCLRHIEEHATPVLPEKSIQTPASDAHQS